MIVEHAPLNEHPHQPLPGEPYLAYDIYGNKTVLASARFHDGKEIIEADRLIVGHEAIDEQVELNLEQFETTGDVGAIIDSLFVIEAFPEHYQTIPAELYETATNSLVATIEVASSDDGKSLCSQAMSAPKLYDMLTDRVSDLIRQSSNLDATISLPLIDSYLESYVELKLNEGGRIEALRRLLLDLQ